MSRIVAIFARASSMGSVFLFGVLFTLTAPANDSASFFVAYAVVSFLVVALGLELHTYSDREIARDMGPRSAIRGLLKIQIPWVIIVFSLIAPIGINLGIDPLHVSLVLANALVGLAGQECFRIFVALGKNHWANLSMVGRTTLPYLVLIVLILSGISIEVTNVLLVWLVGGVVATAFSVRRLWRLPQDQSKRFSGQAALSAAKLYFPTTMIARGLFSLDVIVIGLIASPELVSMYGNAANLAAAFFTFADIAIIQWRFRLVVGRKDGPTPAKRILRDSLIVGIISGATVVLIAVGGGSGLFGRLMSGPEIVQMLSVLAVASMAAILNQGTQILVYASRLDNHILLAYLLAGVIFAAFAALALLFTDPVLAVIGRASGFVSIAVYFQFVLRKVR